MNTLRTVIIVCSLVLLLAACGEADSSTPAPANVDLDVRVEPDPLAVGETTLIVSLKDEDGNPIDGATVQVHGDMDHEGMTPVDRDVSDSTDGEYIVPFEWTMGGGWIVTVTVELPDDGGEISEDFEFFVEAISGESIINRDNTSDAEATPDMEMDHSDMEMDAEATPDMEMDHSDMEMDAMSTSEAVMTMEDEDLPINIDYEPDNDPAIGGDAAVTITLTDLDGNAITDAMVEVTGNMAHEGMMPVSGEGEYDEDGRYIIPLQWTMAGDWQVTVKVTLEDGNIVETTFDQQVVIREE